MSENTPNNHSKAYRERRQLVVDAIRLLQQERTIAVDSLVSYPVQEMQASLEASLRYLEMFNRAAINCEHCAKKLSEARFYTFDECGFEYSGRGLSARSKDRERYTSVMTS